jgi:hypothetical protein
VIRAAGFSPVTAAVALLGGATAAAIAGIDGLVVVAGAVLASRILSAVMLVMLSRIEAPDRPWPDAEELGVSLPRVVQAVVTCALIAWLDGTIRTVHGIIATLVYGDCVLLGWAVRTAATPAIVWLVEQCCGHAERSPMDGRGVSEGRIQEWNDAWTRALEHLERARQGGPPAG